MSKLLCHQPEPDNGKVMIQGICKPNSGTLHDREAGSIDRRQFVQISASEVFPGLLQIAQLAGKEFYGVRPIDGFLPRQRHVSVSIAIKKCECLDDNGNGGVKLRAGSVQQLPLLSSLDV